jgi:tRNA-intron endonuclease
MYFEKIHQTIVLLFPRSYYHLNPIVPAVKATFDGTIVRVGKEGRTLYEQNGYGRLEAGGVRLRWEALYPPPPEDRDHWAHSTPVFTFADQHGFLLSLVNVI